MPPRLSHQETFVTTANSSLSSSFSYQAQTDDGQRMAGTIDAPDVETATNRLHSLRLRVTEIRPADAPSRSRSIRGEDFLAFNQQLAQLTKAGLPVERGLRLIAGDIRRGRLKRTVEEIATELEAGTPLGEAFDKHRDKFPSLYGRIVEAGVRGGNLPGILLNLGRHLETEQRLRNTLWRTLSYPAMVFVGLLIVMLFITYAILPHLAGVYQEFHLALPDVTKALLWIAGIVPWVAGALLVLILLVPVIWGLLVATGKDRAAADVVLLPLPLVGPVLRNSLMARWLDAARIAVDAGLDLPAAIQLADDATGSPKLRRDGEALINALQNGRPLGAVATTLLPATIPAAIEFSSGQQDLPLTLGTLAEMYERQADIRIQMIPSILTPTLVIAIALSVGFVIAGLFSPLVSLINGMTSGK
jgi:type IV pilus assembly protein PilC